ncbi:4a-hydroxytetrahydrobiopterin dehydratase [Polycladomyces subterraneus]|uniref:4a-hydroxytetrahydrobiopterin dehydratase n=1 Tax=Polycladomyces subterraneus TaxID=1016997 RepID=A0ABT8IQ20_9BACL|nr:4a-hydroxytetrahydrobiopterin dehydratase [Polycladomyces subterraneus]MDN4594877.1 4a-hydroxytetrahydrobiopterin dehydratase [Polycladomyces subterraneus]
MKLSRQEIGNALTRFPGWGWENEALVKTFSFSTYMEGVQFAVRVAEEAERLDHHPDMLISYRTVTLTCTTHDAGGVTERDVALIERIERLL